MTGKRVGDICPHCPNTPIMRRRDYFGGFYAWCVMCNRRWVLLDPPVLVVQGAPEQVEHKGMPGQSAGRTKAERKNTSFLNKIKWWKGLDSNQCTLSRADLQSLARR